MIQAVCIFDGFIHGVIAFVAAACPFCLRLLQVVLPPQLPSPLEQLMFFMRAR